MKKLVVLFILLGIFFVVEAQKSNSQNFNKDKTSVSGFDGKKPLKKDKEVEVFLTTPNGSIMFLEKYKAYKGETEEIFLKRFGKTFFDSKTISTVKKKSEIINFFKGEENKKTPRWIYYLLIPLLIFVVIWGFFGEIDKDPRTMTSEEKRKYLESMEKEKASEEKRVQKRELKKIEKQLVKELKKPVL